MDSQRKNTDEYKRAFLRKSKELYSEFIIEYNDLVSKYFTPDKVEKAFDQMSLDLSVDEKVFNKFKVDVRNELKQIE